MKEERSLEQRWALAAELFTALGEEQSRAEFEAHVLDRLLAVLEADAVAIYLCAATGLLLQAQRGFPPDLIDDRESASLASSLAGRAIADGRLALDDSRRPSLQHQEGDARSTMQQGFAMLAAVPLRGRGRIIGALTFAAHRPRPLRSAELAIVHFIAHTLATGIARLGAEEDEQRMRAALEAVNAATLAVAAELDPAGVRRAIVAHACAVTGARYGALGIGTDAAKQFEPWVSSGISEEVVRKIGRPPRPVGLLGAVPGENKVIRLADVAADPRFRGWPEHHPVVKSFLGVPVRLGEEAIGNLYLGDKTTGAEFTVEDEQAVLSLAAHAAIAHRHAQLYDEVQVERNRLRAVFDGSSLGIIVLDLASDTALLNPAAEAMLGRVVPAEGERRQYLPYLRHPDGRPVTLEELPDSRALRGETVIGMEIIVRRPDGQELPMLASAQPIRDHHGAVTGAVVIWQDITPLKLEQLREEFLSRVAHELRTPITSVAGYADLLSRRLEGPIERRAVQNILASARRLERLVLDLLDASRIEARQVQLERQTLHLETLAEDVVDRLSAVMGDHPVRLKVEGNPPPVLADAERIEQVLTNLLTNAAKYSPAGTDVLIVVQAKPAEVVVAVTNEGPGIPRAELPRLFTRFYRTRSARRGQAPGLGLGLYIARGLIEAHGGRIWATSETGQGATFFFALPAVLS